MKYCSSCGLRLADSDSVCKTCGAVQSVSAVTAVSSKLPGGVIALCVITILGSLFGMLRGFFYEAVATIGGNDEYWRGWAFFLVNLGTLTGAILMLNKKMTGLIIYAVFQVSYIGLIFRTLSVYVEPFDGVHDPSTVNSFAYFIAFVFLVPAVVFLILNLTLARKHLR